MPDKNFTFEGRTLSLHDPAQLIFTNPFYEEIYTNLFGKIQNGNLHPHINFDDFYNGTAGVDVLQRALSNNIRLKVKAGDTDRVRTSKAMLAFLDEFPAFFNVLQNVSGDAEAAISAAEFVLGHSAGPENFTGIKKIIDDWNSLRWIRDKDQSERQAGVSTLGTISEKLLEKALSAYIDDTNFFKNNTSDVQSYGDFVLMCLPNNLWISVKSNYARERLLASGFSTDIIGVGFFIEAEEFTSGSKVRNLQKVGFLAVYVPDIPVSEEQVTADTSTYSEIVDFYTREENPDFPLNLHGKPFIRKLSDLNQDIESLLSEANIKKRTTIGF